MIFYRGYVVEWVDHHKDFRVYDPKYPTQTVAYVDSFQNAKKNIDFYYFLWEEVERGNTNE